MCYLFKNHEEVRKEHGVISCHVKGICSKNSRQRISLKIHAGGKKKLLKTVLTFIAYLF